MKRILARFLLVFMLSAYILPFTALTARAETDDESKQFFKRLAGTYTADISQIYDVREDKYYDYWDYWIEQMQVFHAEGHPVDAGFISNVFFYVFPKLEINVDENGNVSGKHSGTFSVSSAPSEWFEWTRDIDYSFEVSAQFTEKTDRTKIILTGTAHEHKWEKAYSYTGSQQVLRYEITKDTDFVFTNKESDLLKVEMKDDGVVLSTMLNVTANLNVDLACIDGSDAPKNVKKGEHYNYTAKHEFGDGVSWMKPDRGAASGISSGVKHDAEVDSGEDSGVDIPTAIVVGTGILGAGMATVAGAAATSSAAAGAAGSSVGTNGGEIGEDERRKKRYKMYIQKDFGDFIQKRANPVAVRARIAEVREDGTEYDRNDLTARINSVSGDGMVIHSAALVGRDCEAIVGIPQNYYGDTADITFTFEGEGGSFYNTVRFRVVGEPKIMFADDNGVYSGGTCRLDAIFGDGFTYTRRLWLKDAVTFPAPDAFSVSGASDFDLSFAATDTPGVYTVNITNRTSEPGGNNPHWDIFNKKEERELTVSVMVEGETEPTNGYVNVTLYPEGISVESEELQVDDRQPDVRYVSVRSYEKEKGTYGGLDSKWRSSDIKFTFAVMEAEGAVINPPNVEIEVQSLKGADENMDIIAQKYKYSEDIIRNGDRYTYYFQPNTTLYEGSFGVEGFRMLMLLPVSFGYNGQTISAEVPLRLRGIPMDPMEEWDKEYEKLKERIRKFSFEEDKEYWIQKLDDLALEPRVSIEELRLVSKCLVRRYMTYWTRQRNADMRDVKFYDFMVSSLEWAKFFGDCAFSLLVTVYAGPLADAVLSPAKDFFAGAVGEIIAADKFTLDTFDNFEFSKNLAAAGDNIFGNAINLTNYKTALATLGGYFVYASFKNYIVKWNEEGVSDLWGALVGGFSDMTVNVVKTGASKLLGKWIEKSDIFRTKISPFITNYFKETQFPNFQAQYNRWQELYGDLALKGADEAASLALTDILDKYVTELVGVGAGKVSEMIDEAVDVDGFITYEGRFYFSTTITLGSKKFKVMLDILKMLETFGTLMCPLGAYLIKTIFGDPPAAPAPINVPKDPPLPEEN